MIDGDCLVPILGRAQAQRSEERIGKVHRERPIVLDAKLLQIVGSETGLDVSGNIRQPGRLHKLIDLRTLVAGILSFGHAEVQFVREGIAEGVRR